MAQFGGNKAPGGAPPWARGGPAPVDGNLHAAAAAAAAGAPGLMGFGGAPGGPGVLQQPHLAALNPSVTLGAAMGVASYPRAAALGPPQFGHSAAQHLLQQQHQAQQAAAAAVGASLQHQHAGGVSQQHGPPGPGQPSQRVFTGTVTKLHDNFGFVDEDVFFQTNVVKGQAPRVNDRVLVEAGYNPNMPFKWNATRIQVLPNQRVGGGGGGPGQGGHQSAQGGGGGHHAGGGGVHSQPPPNMGSNNLNNLAFGGGGGGGPPPNRGGGMMGSGGRGGDQNGAFGGGRDKGNDRGGRHTSPHRRENRDRERRRDDRRDRDRDRDRGNDRDRSSRDKESKDRAGAAPTGGTPSALMSLAAGGSTSSRKRSRSPQRSNRTRSRSRSPPRRRARTTPRYNVSVPKYPLLVFPESNVMDLKKRYLNMYVPSDFFHVDHTWMRTFPTERSFKLSQSPSSFHIFNKELVDRPANLTDATFDPPDADYKYCVKVMLLACPPQQELFEKTCHFIENGATGRENLVHPTRALHFLVGSRGKNETMAIGGPWSPSLDGENPDTDPTVLINTAVRTCAALTGVDLSGCTQWHRFLDVHYRRQETSSKPARTETTVVFMPDVWSVMPTQVEHEEARDKYAEHLKEKLDPKPKEEGEKKTEPAAAEDAAEEAMETDADKAEEGGDEEADSSDLPKPTNYSELDVKALKVDELRNELKARKLNFKGLKSQLVVRLQKVLNEEQEKEEEDKKKKEAAEEEEKKKKEEEEKKKKEAEEDDEMEVVAVVKKDGSDFAKPKNPDEKLKEKTTAAYKFPAKPAILVHPHVKAKSGKFDCSSVSLSVLLDYRTDDNKEGTFEVSLFAELFNEMLLRDSAFKIYKSVVEAPEKKKEEKKPSKDKEDKKDEEKKEESEEKKVEEEKKEGDKDAASASQAADAEKEAKKEEKKKMVTANKELLLACSYFDLAHIGYIESKDLEDILFTLNLSLSRAQIKRLVSKVTTNRDQVNYRSMTDKEEVEKPEGEAEETEEEAEVVPLEEIEEKPEMTEEELRTLALGFRAYLDNFKREEKSDDSQVQSAGEAKEGVCMFRGSVVDVRKLMAQLDRSESARSEVTRRLNDSNKTVKDLKNDLEKTNGAKDKLTVEVKDLKKRLRSTEEDLKKTQGDSTKFFSTIKSVYSLVNPHVMKEKADLAEAKRKEDERMAQEAKEAAEALKREEEANGEEEEVKMEVKEEQVKKEEPVTEEKK